MQQYVKPSEIDACIISHYHADHIADIGVLQHAILIHKHLTNLHKTLPIYGHTEDLNSFNTLSFKDITEGIPYNPNETLHIGPFKISFLKTKHPVPCYAFRIETEDSVLVYTADSAFLEEFIEFSKGADLLLCECNFYANMDGSQAGHMNSLDAAHLAKEAKVRKLVLTHLPHYGDLNNLVEEAKTIFKDHVYLAASEQVWEI